MAKSKRRQSLVEYVIDALLERIRQGNLRPGDQIPTEPEISEALNVSRSSVREAIRVLEILNMIEVRHGVGTFVKNIHPTFLVDPNHFGYSADPEHLLDLLELRKIIETGSAALAAQRATSEELRELARDVDALETAVEEGRRPDEDLGFHLNIAKATHNQSIVDVSNWITAFYLLDSGLPTEKDIDDHRRIYHAIRDQDVAAVREAMRTHLDEIEARLRQQQADAGFPEENSANRGINPPQ